MESLESMEKQRAKTRGLMLDSHDQGLIENFTPHHQE
jgi:hypothetical protein